MSELVTPKVALEAEGTGALLVGGQVADVVAGGWEVVVAVAVEERPADPDPLGTVLAAVEAADLAAIREEEALADPD